MRTSTGITYVTSCFTLFSFVWLLMATVSTPISSHLRMFRLVDGNDEALLDIGVLGACAAPLDEITGYTSKEADCSTTGSGFWVRSALPLTENLGDTGRPYVITSIVRAKWTQAMTLVPVCTGVVGISAIMSVVALFREENWTRGLDVVNFGLHIACACLAWLAFGMSMKVWAVAKNRTMPYNSRPNAGVVLPIVWKWGNALILVLVTAIMLTIGSVLYGFKLFWKRTKVERDQYSLQSRKSSRDRDDASA